MFVFCWFFFQNLASSSHIQEGLVEELAEKSTTILPTLQETDQNQLKDKLHTVRENVKRYIFLSPAPELITNNLK